MELYDFSKIEDKWQKYWDDNELFKKDEDPWYFCGGHHIDYPGVKRRCGGA